MALVRDAKTSGLANPGNSLTISHANAGNLMVVGIGTNGTTDQISGVTYNSVVMTRINTVSNASGSGLRAYLYYLLAPTVGTANIVISATGSIFIQAEAVTYTGAKQTGQPDASATNTASSSTTCANTLTTIADNAIHIAWYYVDAANPGSVTNGTILTNLLAESNPLLITPAASHAMTANSSAQNFASCGASFSPSLTTAQPGFLLRFM